MNYKNIYENLINRAKGRVLNCYVESHHIIPRCIGGGNSTSNLVNLTAEEHYVAHQLLVKIYPQEYGLIKAAVMMAMNTGGNRPKNKLYGWLRRRHSDATSGENNVNFGKPRTDEVKKKISISNTGKGGSKLRGRAKGPMNAETKEKLSRALKGRPNPNQQGDKNVSKRPEVIAKAQATKKGKPRQQKRDKIIFKFLNIKTGEVFEGTRQEFKRHAKITSVDIYALVSKMQKTSKSWKLLDI